MLGAVQTHSKGPEELAIQIGQTESGMGNGRTERGSDLPEVSGRAGAKLPSPSPMLYPLAHTALCAVGIILCKAGAWV